jgi:S1-C subfamily serine protease
MAPGPRPAPARAGRPVDEPAEDQSFSPSAAGNATAAAVKPAAAPRPRAKPSAMPVWGWALLGVLAAAAVGSSVGLGVILARRDDAKAVEEKPASDTSKLSSLETAIAELEQGLKTAEARLDEGKKGRGNRNRLPPDKSFTEPLYGIVKVVKYIDEHREHPRTASGFFINEQNWIVTTHRICENAKSLKVITCSSANGGAGTTYDVEGMIAGNEKQDLAIIKPKIEGPIPGVKPLKLAENPQPVTGMTVYALGSPGKHVHVVTRGMITRVIDRAKLAEEMKGAEGRHEFDLPLRESTSGVSYIEYDARTYPGAYGGPLLNDNLEVIGVQSLLAIMTLNDGYTTTQTYACASHIKHAAELIKSCDGTVKSYPTVQEDEPKRKLPFGPGSKRKEGKGKEKEKEKEKEEGDSGDDKEKPKEAEEPEEGAGEDKKGKKKPKADEGSGEESSDEEVADDELAEKIKELAEECGKFSWTPTSVAEYKQLAKLAKCISRAKEMVKKEKGDEDARKEADEAAGEVLKKLEENPWENKENATKLNKRSPKSPAKDAGAAVIGEVKGAMKQRAQSGTMILFQLVGTDKYVLTKVKTAPETFPAGGFWLVIGTYSGRTANVKLPPDNKEVAAPEIVPWPMVSLEF